MRHLLCPALPRPPVPPRPRAPRPPGSPPPPGRGRARAAPAAASAAPAPARVPGRLIRPGSAPRAARPRPEVMAAVPADLGPVPQSWPPFSGREPGPLARLNPAEPRTPCPCTGGRGPASPPWGGPPCLHSPVRCQGRAVHPSRGGGGWGGTHGSGGSAIEFLEPHPCLSLATNTATLRYASVSPFVNHPDRPVCSWSWDLGRWALHVRRRGGGGVLLRGWGSGSGM